MPIFLFPAPFALTQPVSDGFMMEARLRNHPANSIYTRRSYNLLWSGFHNLMASRIVWVSAPYSIQLTPCGSIDANRVAQVEFMSVERECPRIPFRIHYLGMRFLLWTTGESCVSHDLFPAGIKANPIVQPDPFSSRCQHYREAGFLCLGPPSKNRKGVLMTPSSLPIRCLNVAYREGK